MTYCCIVPLSFLFFGIVIFICLTFCSLTRINASISIADSYSTPTHYTIEYQKLAWSKAAHLEFPVQITATSEEAFRLQKIWINVTAPNSTNQFSSLYYEYDIEKQELSKQLTFTPVVRTALTGSNYALLCQANTLSTVFLHFDVKFTVYLLYPDDYSCPQENRRSTDPRKFARTLHVRLCCTRICPNQTAVVESEGIQGPSPMFSSFTMNSLKRYYGF